MICTQASSRRSLATVRRGRTSAVSPVSDARSGTAGSVCSPFRRLRSRRGPARGRSLHRGGCARPLLGLSPANLHVSKPLHRLGRLRENPLPCPGHAAFQDAQLASDLMQSSGTRIPQPRCPGAQVSIELRHRQVHLLPSWFDHTQATSVKTLVRSPDRPMPLAEAVWIDPACMSGVPFFRGTRVPVHQLFDWIENGVPQDEFLREFQVHRRAAAAAVPRAGASAVCAAAGRIPDCAATS